MWMLIPLLTLSLTACSASTAVGPVLTDSLPTPVRAAIDTAWHDERHAELVYQGVLADVGPVLPFANVVYAERQHASSLEGLLASRGLVAPAPIWTLDKVPRFTSLAAACAAAATAEIENIALSDRLLALDLPWDVRRVFTNNRAASLERHLPAFQRCR